MKFYSTIIFFIVIFFTSLFFNSFIYAQFVRQPKNTARTTADFSYIPKKPGHYTKSDWDAVVDSTWGPGLPLNEKLAIFDEAWNKIDAEFAAFQGLEIDWDSLGNFYRNQIDSTTSRGRFHAIMSYMILALEELHSWVYDLPVMFTPLEPGVPLLYLGGNYENTSHFGATLTPLPDSSLLVLKTVSNHPLGLAPGDIVLGYDGKLWKNLIKELMSFQLPVYWGWCIQASDKISISHNLLCGAGMNWHLFDTLDVVKYPTGDTLHYPTALLAGQNEFIWGNEQLPVPGVDWIYNGTDNIMDPWSLGDYISWGIVDGTNIGYIYAAGWFSDNFVPGLNISQQFYDAVYNLMFVYHVDGLIIDQRSGLGGDAQYQKGLSLLFNSTFQLIACDERSDPDDHFLMSHMTLPDQWLTTYGDPMTLFDRPIANLIGPATMSAQDVFALTIKSHPMVRLFGKPTNGAFSIYPGEYNLAGNSDWFMSHTSGNCYLLDNPGVYLAHHALFPNEEVWFTQEDVAKGEDSVVKRALEWINNLAYAHDVTINKTYLNPNIDSVLITAPVENPNQHELSVTAYLNNMNGVTIDSLELYDDGDHGDDAANDNLWGNFYLPTGEQSYKISVTTNDLTEETSRTLPNVAWFTTIGPVVLDYFEFISSDTIPNPGDKIRIRIFLRNDGSIETASNITAKLTALDTGVTVTIPPPLSYVEYGDIGAGEINESKANYLISFKGPFDENIYQVPFAIDIRSGDYSFWIDTTSILVDIEQKGKPIPEDFSLSQNYPNPFNPSTMINYQLPMTSDVELSIYNLLGQKVATLVNERKRAGYHQVEWDASNMASGVYLYRLSVGSLNTKSGHSVAGEAEGYVETKKMVLMR